MTDQTEAAGAAPEPATTPATTPVIASANPPSTGPAKLPNAAAIEPQAGPPQPLESAGSPRLREAAVTQAGDEGEKARQRSASVSEALKKANAEARQKAVRPAGTPPAGGHDAPEARTGREARGEGEANRAAAEARRQSTDARQQPAEARQQPAGARQQAGTAQQQGAQPAHAEAKPSAHAEAPRRFDEGARAQWDKVPESVRGATHRVIRELEQGYEKHKVAAQAFDEIRDFHELARRHGTTVRDALENYVGIERLLQRDPVAGLERIVANLGLKREDGSPATLADIAASVPSREEGHEGAIRQLRGEIERLRAELGGVSQHMRDGQQRAVGNAVTAFARETDAAGRPLRPRFDELSADIEFFLRSAKVAADLPLRERLSQAYQLAERLNPSTSSGQAPSTSSHSAGHAPSAGPASMLPAQTRTNPQAEAQTLVDRGSKSLSGAPSGEEPARRPSSSIRESLRRAAAAVS